MEDLWKKEAGRVTRARARSGVGDRYIDLFASVAEDEVSNTWLEATKAPTFRKNNEISTEKKEIGDDDFFYCHWFDAIDMYTLSLRFAEVGTENVPVAYLRRAEAFSREDMHKEALRDIELALMVGVPDRLMPELEAQKRHSLSLIDTVTRRRRSEYVPTLDYTAHENYDCLADVVAVRCDSNFGRHFVATSDIAQGKRILVERNYAVTKFDDTGICFTCFRRYKNFIPCETCVLVLYCSDECKNENKTHVYECNTYFGLMQRNIEASKYEEWLKTKLIILTVFNAIATFATVEELIEFVEKTLLEPPDHLPETTQDEVSKYHFFFKLKRYQGDSNLAQAKLTYMFMMELPKIRDLFNTTEKQRFLMHLVTHHMFVNDTNLLGNSSTMIINNVFSMFNHSCEPNILTFTKLNVQAAEARRPIKKGEQLFISYLGLEDMQLSKSERQAELQRAWGFICKCARCESE